MLSNSSTEVSRPLVWMLSCKLLIVGDRPRADAPDRGLDVLRLDRVDDVAGGQIEAGQPVGPHPGAHGVVLRAPQCRIADAGRALDLVEQVDGDVVRDEQRIVGVLGRIDGDDAEQGRRLLLDGDALALHVRAAGLDSATCTRLLTLTVLMSGSVPSSNDTVKRIAAVVAADALHVDHLVDADDLGLDRLRDRRVDDRGGWRRDNVW